MKKIVAVGFIVIVGVLAAVVSIRLSTDALSILVGAILGMMAFVPTLLLVGYLLKKNQEAMISHSQSQNQVQPPVVVVSGGMLPPQLMQPQPQNANPAQAMLPPPTQSAPRKFRLMGYEDADQVELSDEEWVMAG